MGSQTQAGKGHRRYLSAEAQTAPIGAKHSDPLSTDFFPSGPVIFLDATERWPFPDHSFDAIVCELMIEHVPYHAAGTFDG